MFLFSLWVSFNLGSYVYYLHIYLIEKEVSIINAMDYLEIERYANIWKSLLLKKERNIHSLTMMYENGGQDTAPIAFCSPLVGSRCLSLKKI